MMCRFTLLRRKEVINLCDGCRLGCVGDVEVQIPEDGEGADRIRAVPVFRAVRAGGGFLHSVGVRTEVRGRHYIGG